MILLLAKSKNRLKAMPSAASASRCRPPDDMVLLAARIRHLVPPDSIRFVGDFISPRAYKLLGATPVWAADNDAFSGFDPDRFQRMLDRIARGVEGGVQAPMFITVPDVVGSHWQTLQRWHRWHGAIAERGLPRAFVLQDGIGYGWDDRGSGVMPWDDCEALFIGGSTEFKFSREVREIVAAANLNDKWVHMGRVNSVRRMRYAMGIGCDSCDGSGMARYPSSVLLPMVRALRIAEADPGAHLRLA